MAFLEKMGWRYWAVGLIVGVGFPALAAWLQVSPVWRFGGLLLVINGSLALIMGRMIAQRQRSAWLLLSLPVGYLIGAYVFLPHYTQSFSLVYLCLSYLAYGLTVAAQTESKN